MSYRNWIIAGAAAATVALPTAGSAADLMARPAPPVLSQTLAPNWTGVYLGAHLGYGQGRGSISDPSDTNERLSTTMKGALGGGQIGYNYQVGSWVYGLEADISASNIEGTTTFVDPASGDVSSGNPRNRWTSLVTGRVGYALGRSLVYVKGGAAFGGFRYNARDLTNGITSDANFTRTGWTIGAGLEYALTGPWSIRGEYDYLKFSSGTFSGVDSTGQSGQASFRQDIHQFKVGLNYRFGAM